MSENFILTTPIIQSIKQAKTVFYLGNWSLNSEEKRYCTDN